MLYLLYTRERPWGEAENELRDVPRRPDQPELNQYSLKLANDKSVVFLLTFYW
jgi:hypothetical protein